MNHKLWRWSLGSLAVTAPIASVIACSGPTDGLSDAEYKKRIADLTSDEAQIQLETSWLTMVLKENHPEKFDENDHVKIQENIDLIKFYIAKELEKDPKFLSKIATKALGIIKEDGSPRYSIQKLNELRMLDNYEYGYNEKIDKKIEPVSEILMSETSLGFAINIYKNLLMQDYLAIDKKEFAHYWKLQYDREFNFTEIQNLIDDGENFLLVQKIIEQKLFFKWEVEEITAENRWLDPKYQDQKIDAALAQFVLATSGPKTIADYSSYNTQSRHLIKQIWDIPQFDITLPDGTTAPIILANYLGYNGVVSQPNAAGKLDFSKVSLTNAKDKTYWTGILKEDNSASSNELVTEGIDFRDVKNPLKGKLTFLSGIMPIYQDGKLTMKGTIFDKSLIKLAWQVYAKDEKIYNDALKYYADEKKKGGKEIKIKVDNPDVLHIWKDVKKLIYVK